MTKPNKHILVCGSFRASGAPQGVCDKKGSKGLLAYLETELADRGMDDVAVTATGCLKACDRGPVLVVYPDNLWYGGVEDEAAIDAVLDALEGGGAAAAYALR
jgi:(2Fe-2S) ferredoxin